MPVLSSESLNGWLYCAELYFSLYSLSEEDKIIMIGVSLEGDALSWFRWVEK